MSIVKRSHTGSFTDWLNAGNYLFYSPNGLSIGLSFFFSSSPLLNSGLDGIPPGDCITKVI
jgi:hypothetical protein